MGPFIQQGVFCATGASLARLLRAVIFGSEVWHRYHSHNEHLVICG